mgnify:CR=1 FL=1
MQTLESVGRGYYNYYNISSRTKTKDGKAVQSWYDRDLSSEEINSNNAGQLNREYVGADICRKVRDMFEDTAASNRAKYSDPDEMKCAVWAKYSASPKYNHLSFEERTALARTEINMTLFGEVDYSSAQIVGKINGDITKNTVSSANNSNAGFNRQMLAKQIGNVFSNNGISSSLMGGKSFQFSVNGFTGQLSVSLLNGDSDSEENVSLLEQMTSALNSNNNSKNLFYNLLYNSSKQGKIANDQLSKWKVYSEFKNITGQDIRSFKQKENGFVNEKGESASDIYREALKTSKKVPAEFKGAAFDYFSELEKDAMKYDMSKVADLTLSLEYSNGAVKLDGDTGSLNMKI